MFVKNIKNGSRSLLSSIPIAMWSLPEGSSHADLWNKLENTWVLRCVPGGLYNEIMECAAFNQKSTLGKTWICCQSSKLEMSIVDRWYCYIFGRIRVGIERKPGQNASARWCDGRLDARISSWAIRSSQGQNISYYVGHNRQCEPWRRGKIGSGQILPASKLR